MYTCIRLSWCHCHSLSLASVKSRLVYLSGTGLQGSPGQRAIKRLCVCTSSLFCLGLELCPNCWAYFITLIQVECNVITFTFALKSEFYPRQIPQKIDPFHDDISIPIQYKEPWSTRSTQPCIPPGSLNWVPASAGVRAGMSPAVCVIPCDVSFRSGVATLRTAIHLLLTYLGPQQFLRLSPTGIFYSKKHLYSILISGRPRIGANGVSWPPWKNGWKLKSKNMQKEWFSMFMLYFESNQDRQM